MKNSRRVALILVALLSFFVVFSSFYIVKEADHTCSGENCPICYQISMCESTTKSIAGAGAVAVVAALFALVMFVTFTYDVKINLKRSLFDFRVKLSI